MAGRICCVTQDWEAVLPVAYVAPPPAAATPVQREASVAHATPWAPSRLTHTLRRHLVAARLRKLWTLEEAARHTGLDAETLRDLEAGRAILAAINLERVERVLGVRLTPSM